MTIEARQPALAVRDIVKTYRRTRALDGVTLRVRTGLEDAFVRLIGPHGSARAS